MNDAKSAVVPVIVETELGAVGDGKPIGGNEKNSEPKAEDGAPVAAPRGQQS